MQANLSELLKRGARRAFFLIRPSDVFHGGPMLVIEVAEPAQATTVVDWLQPRLAELKQLGDVTEFLPKELQADGAVVLGASSAERLKTILGNRVAKPREEAVAALSALKDADAGVVLFGDAESRRVIREMFPRLPAPFMEIDGRLLADDLQWIALSAKLPPQPTVSFSLQASDKPAATVFQQAFDKARELATGFLMAEMVSGPPAHKQRASALIPMMSRLHLDQTDSRLSITFGDDAEELAFLRNVLPALTQKARDSANISHRMNEFKQIALGLLNYESAKGSLPPAASYDPQGKPLLSWRVLILPYLDELELYKQFHLDEPWDSEHNRPLVDKMPEIYSDPDSSVRSAIGGKGRTTYVVPVGDKLLFGGKEGTKYRDIKDGTSNTILLVEVPPQKAVVWTKPDDWQVNLESPLQDQVRNDRDWFITAWCDGHAKRLSKAIDPAVLRAALTPAGGETIEAGSLK
jgi:hypothetical protein